MKAAYHLKEIGYSKEVIKHFFHPKNFGKINNPSGVGKVGNLMCGDIMWLHIKVEKNKKGQEIIKDAKVSTTGCPAAISVSDMICDLAKGKTLEQAEKITNKMIAKSLKGLPAPKYHCSLLGEEALKEAIKDYREQKEHKK